MSDVPGIAARAELHRERLTVLTCGLRLAAVVQVLAELEIADLLADGPQPIADIAEHSGTNPDALFRVLRMASSFGVFTETAPGVFAATALSEPLRRNVPHSLRLGKPSRAQPAR